MELDVACLRWAKLENLERLARALRIPIPSHMDHEARHRWLVTTIARVVREERQILTRAGMVTPGSGEHQLQIAAALLSRERSRVTPGEWHDRIARSLARLGLLAEEGEPSAHVRTAEKRSVASSKACASAMCAISYGVTNKSAAPGESRHGAKETVDVTDHHPGASVPAAAPPRKTERARRSRAIDDAALLAAGSMMRQAREARKTSLGDVGRRIGVCVPHLSAVERGRMGVSGEVAEAWALAIGLDPALVLCAFRVVPRRAAEAFFNVDRMRAALAAGSAS